jgi:CDP-glucose 4,6-dehydratase
VDYLGSEEQMNPAFWKGKSVLVTGHTGFKGTWLTLWLEQLGARVHGFSLPTDAEQNRFYLASKVSRRISESFGDIRDSAAVSSVVSHVKPEIVLHLAAQALVGASYAEPVATFDVNVMGTVNVLEASRSCSSIQSIVAITTDKCYENVGWLWGYRENDRLGGSDPYSASKAAAELAINSYRSSFFAAGAATSTSAAGLASARAGNVIGGGDYTLGRLVPDVLLAAELGHECVLRNPGATRPWQHVLEPLRGYLVLAERMCTDQKLFSEAWNFGPDPSDIASAQTVAEELLSAWGSRGKLRIEPGEFHEAEVLSLDSTKARSRLDWKPLLNRTQAIHWTVEWTKRSLSGEPVYEIVGDQILRYQTLGSDQ